MAHINQGITAEQKTYRLIQLIIVILFMVMVNNDKKLNILEFSKKTRNTSNHGLIGSDNF